jgi:hypothetical protein
MGGPQVFGRGRSSTVAHAAPHRAHVSLNNNNEPQHLLTVPVIAHLHDKRNTERTALAVIQARICLRAVVRERERGDLVDSHGRWKRPCLQTAHMTM